MRLAFEIVKSCTSEKEALEAESAFVTTFQQREVSDAITEIAGLDRTLEAMLLEEHIVESKSALRRLLEAGAISNFESKEKVTDAAVALTGTYKVGKNRFIKIV